MSPQPRDSQSGFTAVELMIVVMIIAILVALALPGFRNATKSSNENVTIAALRTITTAQAVHRTRYGTYGTLADLTARDLLDETFLMPPRRGYVLSDVVIDTDRWDLIAEPDQPGQSGDRYFYVDESGVIRYSVSGTASDADPAID